MQGICAWSWEKREEGKPSSILQAPQPWRQGTAMAQTLRLPDTRWGALGGTPHAPCTSEHSRQGCSLSGWQLFQLSSQRSFPGLCTDPGSRAACCSQLVWAETGHSRNQHFRAVWGCSDQAFYHGVPREAAASLEIEGMMFSSMH